MECKYVRQSNCICFLFHPTSTSLFSLVHFKNRLRIVQENLYTGLIINQLPVPLREENLEVDNYSLSYNEKLDMIILTLSNHILVYSVAKKTLLVVAEAQGKNNPYYICRTATRNNMLYFSATDQKNIYGVNLEEVIKHANITSYTKYKIAANQIEARQIAVSYKVLIALCSDNVMRIWDKETTNPLRGISIQVGIPTCISFSKEMEFLLIGTKDGYVQVWDVANLGVQNTRIMQQKMVNMGIHSICWFHYSGQAQSHRFLILTEDSSVKLNSFYLEKVHADKYVGKSTQLSLLYSTKQLAEEAYQIQAHSFANFIFFSPGILLYMVDHFPLIYYPIIVKQPSLSFEQLTPNKNKELTFPRDIIFMNGLTINRITDKIEQKLSLQNQLQYKQLKILQLDMRPNTNNLAKKTKIILLYYLNNVVRALTFSDLNFNDKNEMVVNYKQYSGSWIMFIGPKAYYEPLIFIVQDDRQTIMVLAQSNPNPDDINLASEEEKRYFDMGKGQIYTKKINIKINKVYQTPFRDAYVVLYQSDNLLRFSNNINYDVQLINYDVCTTFSLRLDYTDIILDVLWTHHGEMGVVLCLDKVVFINSDLKVMRSVVITGYVVQGQWIGYTLLITTKKDVQFLDILSKPLQAFCLQNLESKYLVLRTMADRIFGIQKIGNKINVRARYFNLMQPLVSGYLNYQKITENPIDVQAIKRIIQCFSPYFIVSEEFVELLNDRDLNNFSKYFIEGNQKMFSRPLRAKILNGSLKIQRFIPPLIWARKKKIILDLFLSYQQSKDATDPYEKDKGLQSAQKLKALIGNMAFDSIRDLSNEVQGVTIANNFGEKSLSQLYHDVNKQGENVRMEIANFKAQNVGQWLGQFGNYIEAHLYFGEEEIGQGQKPFGIVRPGMQSNSQNEDDDNEGQLKDLIVYYRCDDGKGTFVEDLSDYQNNGFIQDADNWIALEQEPMEVEDKWGKKCPPQFALTTPITFEKKINTKKIKQLSIQMWVKPLKNTFSVFSLSNRISVEFKEGKPIIMLENQKLLALLQSTQEPHLKVKVWSHLAFRFNPAQKKINLLINCVECYSINESFKLPKIPQGLIIGDGTGRVEFTEFRMWKRYIDAEDVKQNLRTPLEIVFEKRKKLRMKLKKQEKKKKVSLNSGEKNPFSLDQGPNNSFPIEQSTKNPFSMNQNPINPFSMDL